MDMRTTHCWTSGSTPIVAASRRTALTRWAVSSSRYAATDAIVIASLEASP
jgi:hypothetical protein